jgi:hypothetical protein
MHSPVVFAILSAVLLHGVSSRLYHHIVVRDAILGVGEIKRQSDDSDCLSERFADLDKDLEDSGTDAAKCVAAAQAEASIDVMNSDQASLSEAFRAICIPECGNLIIRAFKECGTFKEVPGALDFLAGLCGENVDGEACYEDFNATLTFISGPELQCYVQSLQTDACPCREVLTSAVDDYGCCLTVYQNFFRTIFKEIFSDQDVEFDYNPRGDLYNRLCNVDVPGDCGNSPITASAAHISGTAAVTAALVFNAVFGY